METSPGWVVTDGATQAELTVSVSVFDVRLPLP
jgi:hypothetical protein